MGKFYLNVVQIYLILQMDQYRILAVIGEGTYGKVFKAQEKETGRVVAIKKFKQAEDEDPHVRKTMMREIKVLKEFRHQNIVNLRKVFRENGKLYLVFDYVQKTLLEELQATPNGLPLKQMKEITYQILTANNFLHEKKIMHRDIKPENLLISKHGVVKLCDFGFARPLKEEATYQYTDYVSTRWYRAPELLVGDAAYSGTVDVWAIGCIFAEIFNGMPLFPGDSDLHTLQLILETITADDMQEEKPLQELSKKQRVAFRLNPLFDGLTVPTAKNAIQSQDTANEVSLKALLKDIDEDCLDFIRKCLVIDGTQRSSMAELLEHRLFDEEFRAGLKEKLEEWDRLDEEAQVEMSKEKLLTKDGKEELNEAELLTQESKKEDEVDEDDDDSSSAICSPNGSSNSTPISSSGIDRPPLSLDHGTAERVSKVPSNNETKSIAMANLNTSGREQSNPTQNKHENGESPASWSNDDSNDSINKEAQQIEEKLAQQNSGSKCLLLSSKNLDSEQNARPTQTEETSENMEVKEVKELRASREKSNTRSQEGQTIPSQGGVVIAEPSVAESNPTNLVMLQTPIKYEPDGSPSEDYNPIVVQKIPQGSDNQMVTDAITQSQKRSSFHQFNKIEGTITEEIKEEAVEGSDKSSGQKPVSVEMKQSLNQIFPRAHNHAPASTHTTEQESEYLAAVDIGSIDTNTNSMQRTLNKPNTQSDLQQIKTSVPLQGQKLHSEQNVIPDLPGMKQNGANVASSVVTEKIVQGVGSAGGRSKSETPAHLADDNEVKNVVSPTSIPNSVHGSQSSLAQLGKPQQESSHRVNQSKGSQNNKISKVNITFVNDQQSDRKNSLLALQANAIANQGTNTSGRVVDKTSILATSINQSGQSNVQIHNHVHSHPHSQSNSLTRTFHHNQGKSSSRGQIIQRNSISLQQNPSKINQLQQHTARCEEETPKKQPGAISMTINQNNFVHAGSFKGHQNLQIVSNNNSALFGVEGNSMGKIQVQNQQSLLTQKSNGVMKENQIKGSVVVQNSQFSTQKPVYSMMKYPQTQVKTQSYKQAAVMKQTASMEKLDRGFTPQKLPNLKAVQSSMSQYSKMEESKIGDGLLPQRNSNSQSKQGLHFSQQRKEPAQKMTESNQSMNKMNFTHQNYHRPTQSNNSEFKQIPNRAHHPGVLHSNQAQKQHAPMKLVSFPKLSEDHKTDNPHSTYINKSSNPNMQQRYQDSKHQKFVSVAPTDQASITVSSAFAEHVLANGNQNVTQGKNFQPSLTNEYMLSKESLLEASRPSLHNNSHYMEGVKPSQMPNKVNQLAIQGQKSQSNNQSFHSTMQQTKNNKFVDQKFNKQSGSGGLVMGRRQQHQNVSTSNMTLAKSIVAIGGDSFEFGNQVVQPIGNKSKQSGHSEVKSQPAAIQTSKQQQSHINSLFTKGKFFQSHQLSHGSHYGNNQGTSTQASPGSVNNQGPPPSSLSNFEKDNSFPRRNITNKLKNAGNLQYQRKNARDQMGPSPSPMNASGKQGGQIMLPNLQNGASNQTLNNLLQSNDQQRQSKISLSPNIKPVIEHSPNINGTKKLGQPPKNGFVQLNASEFNLKLSGTNNSSHGQHIVRKPPHVIQRSNQRQQQYQMYLTPSQNYTSGNTTGMVRGTSHQAHKNVGSTDSMLKKMSVENPSLNNPNGPKSPMNNVQFKVKTETNWNKGNQQIFDNQTLSKQQNQLYRMNNQVVEKSISPERIQQAMKRQSGIEYSQPVKSPNLLKHKLRQNPQQFI